MRRSTGITALLLAAALTACSGGSPAKTASSPSPSPTPSPTPTLPSVTTDAATAKAAIVTAKDLGTPFVQPKKVNSVKHGKGELCPGHAAEYTVLKPRAAVDVQMTEGTKTGAGIVSYAVRVYAFDQEQAWRDAQEKAENACRAWKAAEGNFVTLETLASPPPIAGADETHARIERVWADAKHTQLQYVRQVIYARTGRIVSMLEYAYLVPKTDPTGKDTTRTVTLLSKQVVKVRRTFRLLDG